MKLVECDVCVVRFDMENENERWAHLHMPPFAALELDDLLRRRYAS